MDDLPNVDEELVLENERRFDEKEAMKLERVLRGEDDRIAGADGADESQKPMTLAEHEAKWGFSYSELQAATKVVSILFSNPALYVGDQYLADSRLYTMITRDRKTKRENQEVLRHVLNEERNRKEKIKRQQDIATIRKTTMKKEREEALGNLLLLSDNTAQLAIEEVQGQSHRPLLLTNESHPVSAPEPESEPVASPNIISSENTAAVASGESHASAPSAVMLDSQLYRKRCVAGLELLDVIHHPYSLIPKVALPKPVSGKEKENKDSDFDGEEPNSSPKSKDKKKSSSEAPAHVVRIKHGNNNKKGKKMKQGGQDANDEEDEDSKANQLTPADVQQWRCHLTSLYHRFWPVKEFSTQMTLSVTVADTWDPLTPKELRSLSNPSRLTVDDIHHDLCVATSQVGLIVDSLLDDYRSMVANSSDASNGATISMILDNLKNSRLHSKGVARDPFETVIHLLTEAPSQSLENALHSPTLFATLGHSTAKKAFLNIKVPQTLTTISCLRAQLIENIDDEEAGNEGEKYVETVTLQSILDELRPQLEAENPDQHTQSLCHRIVELLDDVQNNPTEATIAESCRLLGLKLLELLSKCVSEHWAQYKRRFASVHKIKGYNHAQTAESGANDDGSVREEIDEDEDIDFSAHPDVSDPFHDPHPNSILSRALFSKLAWCVICYFAVAMYTTEVIETPNRDPSTQTAPPQLSSIFDGSRKLFNGIKLDWLGLPPEAEMDGTIMDEEGVFEKHTHERTRSKTPLVGLPYQDAMMFAAPHTTASVDPASVAGGAMSSGYAPSGCIVALRKETSASLRMNRTQKCHTCKGRYKFLHPFYYSLCRPCSDYNYNKRLITRDLTGKVVLLTGVRIKIGYAMAISLLRCGATVIGTTRFAMDAVGRFSAEPDYEQWKHRLHLYSVDLRDLWLVTQFCNFLSRKFPKMFAIINNAAQTIARTPAYTADLRRLEADPPAKLVETFNQDQSAAEWRTFFLHNTSVTVGQSLHLEYHPTENPIVDGDFTSENTALRSKEPEVANSLHGAHNFSAAAEAFLAKETTEEKLARLRRDGGDALGTAVLNDSQLATVMAKRSDRYDTFAEESDKREKNSWTMNLHEVQGSEATEVMAINALSPFILNSRLKPLLLNREGEDEEEDENEAATATHSKTAVSTSSPQSNRALKRLALAQAEGASKAWNTRKASRFIINVSAMEGQFYRHKLTTHPHTNMAKAALNMMTRTSADDYARDGIFMNSVDTGWITDESPASKKQRRADDHMLCPLDEVDAAARCLDLIYTDSREFGKFWKNYKVIPW